MRPPTHPSTTLFHLIFLTLLLVPPTSSQCNTNQNPYCAGNSQFEQLCCTYPNICYWSNRNGDPACCQAGSDCRNEGGPAPSVVVFTAVQQTTVPTTVYVQTVYSTTTPQLSTVTYYSWEAAPQPATTTTYVVAPAPAPEYTSFSTVVTPAVVVVTQTTAVVESVVTNGVFVTFTQAANGAGRGGGGGGGGIRWYSLGGLVALVVSIGVMVLI